MRTVWQYRKKSANLFGSFLILLALVSQLAIGCLVLTDFDRPSSVELAQIEQLCDAGAQHRQTTPGDHRHHSKKAICPLSVATHIGILTLAPADFAFIPFLIVSFCRYWFATPRAPPILGSLSGLPRGPPSSI